MDTNWLVGILQGLPRETEKQQEMPDMGPVSASCALFSHISSEPDNKARMQAKVQA
jgi:hypothetical protein